MVAVDQVQSLNDWFGTVDILLRSSIIRVFSCVLASPLEKGGGVHVWLEDLTD